MAPAQLLTQLIGGASAACSVWWAVREAKRDWRQRRLPLARRALSLRGLLLSLGLIVPYVLLLWVLWTADLGPSKDEPGWIAFTLCWVAVDFVTTVMVVLARTARNSAEGWLSIEGDETLRIDAEGKTVVLRLVPGSVRLYFVDDGPQSVQFEIRDGEVVVNFRGQIAIRDMNLVTQGRVVAPRGMLITSSMGAFFDWLRPFIEPGG